MFKYTDIIEAIMAMIVAVLLLSLLCTNDISSEVDKYYGDVRLSASVKDVFLTTYAIKTDDSFLLEASTSGVDSKWSSLEYKAFHACLKVVEGGWMGIYVPSDRDIYSLVHNVSQCAYGADHLID